METHGVHKVCSDCGELKELGEFNKHSSSRDKHRSYCRQCHGLRNARRPKHPVTVTEKECNTCGVTKGAGEFNRSRQDTTGLYANCRICHNASSRKHHKENPDMANASHAKRRAAKLKRRPPWANDSKMRAKYTESHRMETETGVKHQVDHTIPLQGVLVSGLDWEGNLQVITAAENTSKSNHYDPWTGEHKPPCPEALIELRANLEE